MNSGILSILTHLCPYQFRGLKVISTIFYILDLVLFITFSSIFILRFIMFKTQAYKEIVTQQMDLMFCACWPIAWMTLTTLTPLICSNAFWGGYGFSILGYVMWWIAVVWCLTILFWAFGFMFEQHTASPQQRLLMGIILPAVSVSTAAVEGASVVSFSYNLSARLAVPVIVTGYMLVGMGFLLGLMLTTYLFYEHLSHGWLPPEQTPTMFMFIGPMGQSASALLQLASAARTYGAFENYNKGTFLTAEAAAPIQAVSTMIALMLAGLGFIWLGLSIYAMLRSAMRRELVWAHTWNSIIFPTGTLVTSMSSFSIDMDSPAFRVIFAIMLIILVIVFLVNLAFVGTKIWTGQLLIVREDPRVKKQLEEDEKQR